MTEEIWRPIEGYEGLYEVSSYGRVRSLDRYDRMNHFRKGRIMKQSYNGNGYLTVDLCLNGKVKKYLGHRLVAQVFIKNPCNLPQINHIDEDKSNNRVENLEWCDAKYNTNYGTARIRGRETAIKNGNWTGLSEKEYRRKYRNEHREHMNEWKREYMKKYYQENKDKINEMRREYRRKRKAGL